jgi:hypothetical protein
MKPQAKKHAKKLERLAKAAAARRQIAKRRADFLGQTRAAKEKARIVQAPPLVKEIIREQVTRFRERYGRDPREGEPIFFDPSVPPELGPKPVPEDAIEAIADALGAPVEVVAALIRAGLVLRQVGTNTGRIDTSKPNEASPPREAT